MDAFRLRETVVADYAEYVQSFLAILDPRIRAFVDEQLADGMLWPDPLLQLSPAYQPVETVAELTELGVLHQVCGQLFQVGGRSLRLHQHQRTAIDLATRGLNYVVTTGTGSGKSLTYLLPVVDHVLRHTPVAGGVRAIIVYPMNALINSQEQALTRFADNLGGRDACPVRFARYTGQVEQQRREDRERDFRAGSLKALFCSPTMELGIDIADLNVVHLRNVPPTPANYAQRSGRAGRSGQPAFVATYCSVGSGHDQYFFRKPERMVSGQVVPPRLDLANPDLLQAHVHAVWLATVGLPLGRSMIDLLDNADPTNGFPLRPQIALAVELSPEQRRICMVTCRALLATALPALAQAAWYHEGWLAAQVDGAAQAFDRACDRWRELYAAAERQLQQARADVDRRYIERGSREEQDDARRRELEALRQKDLLCNTGQQGETDFYPYRYFASEGFLPGYNFPRLPIRAFLPTSREEGTFIARPRFLALSEFGPRNVIYHEGRKYRVTRTILPAGGIEARLRTAKLCHTCGYIHEGDSVHDTNRCAHCHTLLDAATSLTTNETRDQRAELEDLGYRVLSVQEGDDLESLITRLAQ